MIEMSYFKLISYGWKKKEWRFSVTSYQALYLHIRCVVFQFLFAFIFYLSYGRRKSTKHTTMPENYHFNVSILEICFIDVYGCCAS